MMDVVPCVVSADKMKSATRILNVSPVNASVIAQEKPAETTAAAIFVAHAMKTSSAMGFPNANKSAFLIALIKHAETMDVVVHVAPAPQDIFAKVLNALKQNAPRIAKGRSAEMMDAETPVASVWAIRSATTNFNVKTPPASPNAMESLVVQMAVEAPVVAVPRDKIVLTSNANPANASPPVCPTNNAVKMDVAGIAVFAEVDRNAVKMSA